MANPETPPKLDWASYQKNVPIAGMVDKFQKAYEALHVPYPADNVTSQVEAQEKQVKEEISKFVQNSEGRIAEYQSQIAALKALLPYDQMTMEDYRDAYPDVRPYELDSWNLGLLKLNLLYSKLWMQSTAHRSGHTSPKNRKLELRMLSLIIKGVFEARKQKYARANCCLEHQI